MQNKSRTVIWACLLAIVTVLVYSNTFDVPFLLDDRVRIEENVNIQTAWPPAIPMTDSNRPFGIYTFALNYAWHGYQVWGYHATNLAIHILAGLTLFGIVRRTLSSGVLADRYRTSATPLAFSVALLWLVHPLNTQAVTYIVQRLESLMGLCYLLTLYCFIRAQDSAKRAFGWYSASIVCCAFGMGVKEVMVTAPLMVLWYHRTFVAQSWQAMFHGKSRYYYPILFATWGVLAWAMLRSHTEYESGAIGTVKGVTPIEYLLSQAGVITHYLQLSVWPYGQCFDYGWPVARTTAEIVPPLLFIGALFVATVWATYRYPAWGFLGGWFFVILGPTSSIVPILDLAFEQRMYLPLAAVVAVFVFAVRETLTYLANRRDYSEQLLRSLGVGIIALVILQMSVLTWARNEVFRRELSLWEDAVIKAPQNARAHYNFGTLLYHAGDSDRALLHCQKAVDLKPDYAEAHTHMGVVLMERNQLQAAEACHRKALALNANSAQTQTNLGITLWKQGKHELGLKHFRQAIALNPRNAEAHTNLGKALAEQGQTEEALASCRKALELRPDDSKVLYNIAVTLDEAGQGDEAIAHYQKAIKIKPAFPQAHHNLATLLAERGRLDEAIKHFRQAIEISPNLVVSYLGMGDVLAGRGDTDGAITCYEKALSIDPADTQAADRLKSIRNERSNQAR